MLLQLQKLRQILQQILPQKHRQILRQQQFKYLFTKLFT
jgi:hypothetical protein